MYDRASLDAILDASKFCDNGCVGHQSRGELSVRYSLCEGSKGHGFGRERGGVESGGPNDDPDDMEHPVCAGQLPMGMTLGVPIPDPANLAGLDVPDYL